MKVCSEKLMHQCSKSDICNLISLLLLILSACPASLPFSFIYGVLLSPLEGRLISELQVTFIEQCDKYMCKTCNDQIRVINVCFSLDTPKPMVGGNLQEVGQWVIKHNGSRLVSVFLAEIPSAPCLHFLRLVVSPNVTPVNFLVFFQSGHWIFYL